MPKKDAAESHDKPCTICGTPRSVLVRCQVDEFGKWNFVCPGKCWKEVSGGVEDAKGLESQYPHYRYGGMWKNKHADGPISAKKPRKVKERQKQEAADRAASSASSESTQDVGNSTAAVSAEHDLLLDQGDEAKIDP